MTQARRLMIAGAITLTSALALFAVVANTGAFRDSNASSAPPVDIAIDGTAFVTDETGLGGALDPNGQVTAEFVDEESFEGESGEGANAESEHEDHDDHEGYEDDD